MKHMLTADGYEAASAETITYRPEMRAWVVGDTNYSDFDGTAYSVSDEPGKRRLTSTSITPRQARLALLGAGLLDQVSAAIASLPEPQKSAATIDWEYAVTVERNSPLVVQLGGALGLTEAQIDDLFVAAAAL